MTYEETIELLQESHKYFKKLPPPVKEALEIARICVKKSVPVRAHHWYGGGYHNYRCGSCGKYFGCEGHLNFALRPKYCSECGQAIDWREVVE